MTLSAVVFVAMHTFEKVGREIANGLQRSFAAELCKAAFVI